jgi:glycosyltransferase involved in cell wall biosynthesis
VTTVWHISSNRWNSAITEYALSAVRATIGLGWSTHFSPLRGSPAEERALEYGLSTYSLGSFGVAGLKQFLSVGHDIQPDLVFVYGGSETFLTMPIKAVKPKIKIVRFRGQDIDPLNWGFAKGLRQNASHKHVHTIITPSVSLSDRLRRVADHPPVATVVLGCDTEKYFYKGDHRSQEERPMLVILGRLDPIKGHERFIRCFGRLLDGWAIQSPKPVLKIVGESANLTDVHIKEFVRRAGLKFGSDVLLDGSRVADLPQLFSQTTLGVIPSLGSEVICRVAEEFLLGGTPILVSGVGSLNDVLFENAGMTYAGLNDDQLVDVLKTALIMGMQESSEDRLQRAKTAERLYSLEGMGARLKELLF